MCKYLRVFSMQQMLNQNCPIEKEITGRVISLNWNRLTWCSKMWLKLSRKKCVYMYRNSLEHFHLLIWRFTHSVLVVKNHQTGKQTITKCDNNENEVQMKPTMSQVHVSIDKKWRGMHMWPAFWWTGTGSTMRVLTWVAFCDLYVCEVDATSFLGYFHFWTHLVMVRLQIGVISPRGIYRLSCMELFFFCFFSYFIFIFHYQLRFRVFYV